MRREAILAGFVAIAGASASPASAQDGTRSVAAMLDCRTIVAADERLRCFDRAVAGVVAARSSGELLTLDRSKVVATKQRGFGLPATSKAVRIPAEPLAALEAVRQVDSTVVAVRPAEYGRYLLALANNSVWKNAEPLRAPPVKGVAIRIVRANFGAFRATIGKERPFLIKRVQ